MSRSEWSGHSYLDALRPPAGARTDVAVLATYSVDLVAMVAALLALAGVDDDRGSGRRVDFASALDQLQDRVRVVAQSGRIVAPASSPKILGILDRYVREVPLDEERASWHPKVALVRMIHERSDSVEWRLWIGSRNLTRDRSWDVGLTLVGHQGHDGRHIPGVVELAGALARRADLPHLQGKTLKELADLRWQMPQGCVVEEIQWLEGEGRRMPAPPPDVRSVTVVSPFLDGGAVSHFGRWGNEVKRTLLSTRSELGKLKTRTTQPLRGFRLLALDAPAPEALGVGSDAIDPAASEDEEEEARGLHAKLILVEHAGGRTLWLGSANATRRGWAGPNVEVVARVSIEREVAEGLRNFVDELGREVELDELPPEELDGAEDRLDRAHGQVAAQWVGITQELGDDEILLGGGSSPHPEDCEIELAVGLLGQPLTPWPRGERRLVLPGVSVAEATELVRCQITLGTDVRSWIQRTPMDPPLDEERDRQAMAQYLDAREFLLWIRCLLTDGSEAGGGDDWSAPRRAGVAAKPDRPDGWSPTLEQVLKAWTRDPRTVADVDRKVRRYLDAIRGAESVNDSPEEREVIEEFQASWKVLRRELVGGGT